MDRTRTEKRKNKCSEGVSGQVGLPDRARKWFYFLRRLVRPSGFEPPTFCSGGKPKMAFPLGFNIPASARNTDFGLFAAIWVGIWVGEVRAKLIGQGFDSRR